MIINPGPAARRWTIRVRVTTTADPRLAAQGDHQWSIWCGPDRHMIRVMKATRGAHFDSASKRWIFYRPAGAYGAMLQKLLDYGYRIDLEDPNLNARKNVS